MSRKKAIYEVARDECDKWTKSGKLSRGVVMAILFAFCHRWTTGESVEELIDRCSTPSNQPDYQI